jgi:hypothetical protein
MSSYVSALTPFYSPSMLKTAHLLAEPALCFGIPVAYFILTMAGYFVMRSQKAWTPPDWFKSVYNLAQVIDGTNSNI